MRFSQRQTKGGDSLLRTSIQLRPETVAKLDAICDRENLSRAAIISRLIEKGLEVESAVGAR